MANWLNLTALNKKWVIGAATTIALTAATFAIGAFALTAMTAATVVAINAAVVCFSYGVSLLYMQNKENIPKITQKVYSTLSKYFTTLRKHLLGNTQGLILAAYSGDTNKVALLIQLGVNVNAIGYNGATALMCAAERGHADIVAQLLAAGANVNAFNNAGGTALMLAASNGHAGVITQLLAAGANVDATNLKSETSLSFAAENGHVGVVTQLLYAGADTSIADIDGNLAVMYAADNGHYDIVALLQQGGALLQINAVNAAQSVHEISVHKSVSESIAALKKHYNGANLRQARQEFITWINGLTEKDKETQAAKRAIQWLQNLDYTDIRSKITIQEAFALVWLGVNDINALAPEFQLKKEDIPARRKTLIHQLYDIQRGYNLNAKAVDNKAPDDKTCPSGAFNKMVAALAGAHSKVTLIIINMESMALKAQGIVNEAFMNLTEDLQRKFATLSTPANGMPDELLKNIKGNVETKLHDEFDEFNCLVNNYDQAFKIAVDNLEYSNPPNAVKAVQLKCR